MNQYLWKGWRNCSMMSRDDGSMVDTEPQENWSFPYWLASSFTHFCSNQACNLLDVLLTSMASLLQTPSKTHPKVCLIIFIVFSWSIKLVFQINLHNFLEKLQANINTYAHAEQMLYVMYWHPWMPAPVQTSTNVHVFCVYVLEHFHKNIYTSIWCFVVATNI